MASKIEEYRQYVKEMNVYNYTTVILYWDQRTGIPKMGLDSSVEALSMFSAKAFEMSISDQYLELLNEMLKVENFKQLNEGEQFSVKKDKRDIEKFKRVPVEFYEAYVKEQNYSEQSWEEAKNKEDFTIFQPHLEKIIEMTKQMVAYTDPDKEAYDALIDKYEEGMDSQTIDRLFYGLKEELVPFIKKILAAKEPDSSKFERTISAIEQEKCCDLLLKYIGFNFDKGKTGLSEHPFTINANMRDVRVTNHFYENNVLSAFFSVIHEGGHAIFEQNVNPIFLGTQADGCMKLGIHESQSRFFENVLGRNIHFWEPIFDQIKALVPEFADVTLEELEKEINHVKNSFIRTDADEVTYVLHVIIRYELEKAIFREGAKVADLPKMWNEKMKEYLDIVPESDKTGILQDMHWSDGSFGYFPTYLLGTIYDGMYLEELEKEMGSIDDILAAGDVLKIQKWLSEKIHVFGNTRTSKETIQAVCGKEIDYHPTMEYFKKKYTKIYDLK